MAVGQTGSTVSGGVMPRQGRPLVAPLGTPCSPDPRSFDLAWWQSLCRTEAEGSSPQPGTHSVCSSSGLGTHCSRWESSWKALLWGSSMSRPYRALIRYGLFFTSSSCRRRSAGGQRAGVRDQGPGQERAGQVAVA